MVQRGLPCHGRTVSYCTTFFLQDDDAEQDGSSVSARKRRRLRYNSARDAADKAKQADATQTAAMDSSQLSPAFASDLLQVRTTLMSDGSGICCYRLHALFCQCVQSHA
jgi:hypothetical protein